MMKRGIALLLCLCLLPLFTLATTEEERLAYSLQMFEDFRSGNEEAVLKDMTPDMEGLLKGKVGAIWLQIRGQAGSFQSVGPQKSYEKNGFQVTETGLYFQNMYLVQTISFDPKGKVAGLSYTPAARPEDVTEAVMPEGVTEENITVTAEEAYPLPGTLTLPKGDILAGFVLVHGSGPNDRDETIGANKPFRDLAWGLASRGFAVLRYDKRTLVYGSQIAADPDYPTFTADGETALDAAAAIKQLQSLPGMEGRKVFLIGHSMGGMLASYIGTLAPETAGYVLMAGTPRKLWEIIVDQNLMMMEGLSPEETDQANKLLAAEQEKAAKLLTLTDDEALLPENAPFTLSAWYLRHLENIDAAKLHLQDKKPVLVMQGEKDRQVTMKDFYLWKERLAGHPDAVFTSYPELNHLFGQYEGEPVPPAQLVTVEYMQPTPIPQQVIDDIAAWAKERAK